jgi:hypothetical protein
MAYQNKYDKDGTCAAVGQKAEDIFKSLAEERGYVVEVSSREQQFNHIDFILKKDGSQWKIDIKGAKKISRANEKPCFEHIWIEKKNCRGQDGWILGASSHIAFQQEDHFIIVPRKDLLKLVEKLCDFDKLVTQSKKALYCGYRRFGRQDLLTLIKTTDLYQIKYTIWEKGQN